MRDLQFIGSCRRYILELPVVRLRDCLQLNQASAIRKVMLYGIPFPEFT